MIMMNRRYREKPLAWSNVPRTRWMPSSNAARRSRRGAPAAYASIDATSGMTAEPMAAIMIRRTAWGVVASRSSTSAITTTDRMRENSTKLTSCDLEVSVLRKQAPAKKSSGAVRVDAIRTPR